MQFATSTEAADWIKERMFPLPSDRGTLQIAHIAPSGYFAYFAIPHLAYGAGGHLVPRSEGGSVQPGSLDPVSLHALTMALAADEGDLYVWAAWWRGWGRLESVLSKLTGLTTWSGDALDGATFELAYESYVLLRGPLRDLNAAGALGMSPQFCWPSDRSWVVVTGIDFEVTVVGVDRMCASRLAEVQGLDMGLVTPSTSISALNSAEGSP